MFHRLTCRLPFVALLVAFMFSVVSFKKDDVGGLATSSGMNTFPVQIDGQRYQPKTNRIGTVDDQAITHNGVDFVTLDNRFRVTNRDFKKSTVYGFGSNAVLNRPKLSMLSFALVNIFEAGQQDKMQPVLEGTYAVLENDKPGVS